MKLQNSFFFLINQCRILLYNSDKFAQVPYYSYSGALFWNLVLENVKEINTITEGSRKQINCLFESSGSHSAIA